MIVPIGAWAMREACRQAVELARRRPGGSERLVGPVPSRRACNKWCSRRWRRAVSNPIALEIEITESIFLEGSEETLRLLHGLRSIGVRIALDDFGTGYSH